MNLSKIFITTEVKSDGPRSFIQVIVDFLGSGIRQELFHILVICWLTRYTLREKMSKNGSEFTRTIIKNKR
jgi:predicted DNA-binding ArsR family transcriptional regulator